MFPFRDLQSSLPYRFLARPPFLPIFFPPTSTSCSPCVHSTAQPPLLHASLSLHVRRQYPLVCVKSVCGSFLQMQERVSRRIIDIDWQQQHVPVQVRRTALAAPVLVEAGWVHTLGLIKGCRSAAVAEPSLSYSCAISLHLVVHCCGKRGHAHNRGRQHIACRRRHSFWSSRSIPACRHRGPESPWRSAACGRQSRSETEGSTSGQPKRPFVKSDALLS